MTSYISSLKKGKARAAAVLVTFLYSGKRPGKGKLAHWLLANKPILLSVLIFPLASKIVILQRQVLEEGREGEGGIRRESQPFITGTAGGWQPSSARRQEKTSLYSRPLNKPEQGIKLLGARGTY